MLFIGWAKSFKFCPASKKSVHRSFENRLIKKRYTLAEMFYLFNVAHSNTSTSSIQTGVNSEKNNFDKSLWSMRNNYAHMVHMFISLNYLKSPLTRSKMDFLWMIPNNKLFKFMKDNLHLKKYKIEELPTDLVEEIRRTFQIFDVDNGKIFLFGLPYLGQGSTHRLVRAPLGASWCDIFSFYWSWCGAVRVFT